jgi:ribosomal protein S18 acetylase RimI-like enzyme
MSTGVASVEGVRQLIDIERTRGTQYFVARLEGVIVGMIGLWFDPTGATSELEPPQVIDIAVSREHRLRGIARDLMDVAVSETRAAGYNRLWLYTDGNNAGLLTFYRHLGFRLAAVIPEWFGDGSVKAVFRLDLA